MDLCSRPFNIISLCTGGGGLDLGVELAVPHARSVCYVEREAFAIARLVEKMQKGLMAAAPVFSDVTAFRGRPWRGLVDGLIGGIPCQPHSLAGRKLGSHDERDLWSATRRIIVQARPRFVLIENVRGMLSAGKDEIAGAERVWRDLQRLSYTVIIGLFSAAEVGAPHERCRTFILAVADGQGFGIDAWRLPVRTVASVAVANVGCGDGQLADATFSGCGRESHNGERAGRLDAEGGIVGDSDSSRWAQACGGSEINTGRQPIERCCALVDATGQRQGQRRGVPHICDENGRSFRELSSVTGVASKLDALENATGDGRGSRRPEHEGFAGRTGAAVDVGSVADTHRTEPASQRPNNREMRGVSEASGEPEHRAAIFGRDRNEVANTDDRPGSAESGQQYQEWLQEFGRGSDADLFPPGPADREAWSRIGQRAPERLPAVSRHDLFCFAMGAQGLAPDGDPSRGAWVDAQTGQPVHPSRVSAAIEQGFRDVAHGVAGRVDDLRMLGNGVVPLEAAYAVRTLLTRLATNGSATATQLVRMTEIPSGA